jgi:peptidoglycan/xylan/chitin deacetylase (PgdA/CDA1 family)
VGTLRSVRHWLRTRDNAYIAARGRKIVLRYGITSSKAQKRLLACIESLGSYGCFPTFPTPGRVLRRSPQFFRELQGAGSELAVHGYDHVDFRSLSVDEARAQFTRAIDTFRSADIEVTGFRCPYLGFTEELLEAVPTDVLQYSSNDAILWGARADDITTAGDGLLRGLRELYQAESSDSTVAVPRFKGALLEVPASLPDDLQLYDALALGEEGVSSTWSDVLSRTHARGELFTALFHPEAFAEVRIPLEGLLREARAQTPGVWIARLREINEWWREKARFSARVKQSSIELDCSDRATVLVRDFEANGATRPWRGRYRVLDGRSVRISNGRYPLVGLAPGVPAEVAAFLRDQGYLLYEGEDRMRCTVVLAASTVSGFANEVELLAHLESSPGPLVRFWRWPDEAGSALSVTGDLDALSLVDYGVRLLPS